VQFQQKAVIEKSTSEFCQFSGMISTKFSRKLTDWSSNHFPYMEFKRNCLMFMLWFFAVFHAHFEKGCRPILPIPVQ